MLIYTMYIRSMSHDCPHRLKARLSIVAVPGHGQAYERYRLRAAPTLLTTLAIVTMLMVVGIVRVALSIPMVYMLQIVKRLIITTISIRQKLYLERVKNSQL